MVEVQPQLPANQIRTSSTRARRTPVLWYRSIREANLSFERTPQGGYRTAMKTKQKGFSLIELLVVVAVILILAAIAIPNFIKSTYRAHESSAIGSLHTINTAY